MLELSSSDVKAEHIVVIEVDELEDILRDTVWRGMDMVRTFFRVVRQGVRRILTPL